MLKRLAMFALIGVIAATTLAACGSGDDKDKIEPTVTREAVEGAPPDGTFFTPTVAVTEAATQAPAGPGAASPAAGEASPVAGEASPVAATPGETESAGETAPAGGATAISVETIELAFNPKELTGAANQDVVITITNNGALAHDFSIPDLGITSKMLNPGESTTVTVNAAAGTYNFECTVPGHAAAEEGLRAPRT